MKSTATLLSLLLFGTANAQITITGQDLPQAGTTYLLGNDTTPAISLGTPGANWQSWDFSALTSHYYKVADFAPTSGTPYTADFPTSNVDTYGPSIYYSTLYGGAPVDQSGNGYMFWKSDTTGFWAVGFRGEDGPYANNNVYESPPELLIGAPATYGTAFSNSSRWELAMNLIPSDIDTFYIVNREKSIFVDAWGTLTTPYDTFPDVIRYHEYFTEQDSVRSEYLIWDSTFLFMADTGNIYTYMANGTGYPAAIVFTDKNDNVKSVEYMVDSAYYIAIQPHEALKGASACPNPANSTLTITAALKPDHGQLSVYNITGEQIMQVSSLNRRSIVLDVSPLPGGIYMYQLIDDQGVNSSGKFIKN